MTKIRKSELTALANQAAKTLDIKAPSGKINLLFFPRRNKGDLNTFSVYCTISYNGNKKTLSTGITGDYRKLLPGSTYLPDDENKVALLNDFSTKLFAAYTELKITKRKIDLQLIWNMAKGNAQVDMNPNLLHCMDLFLVESNEKYKAGVTGYKAYEKIMGFDKRIREFIIKNFGKWAEIDDIKPAHATTLRLWLVNECKLSASYTDQIVSHFKRILEFAVENEWVNRNAFMRFKARKSKKFVEALNEAQVDKLRTFDVFAPALEPVRQAFLLQCYTGLSYIDMVTVTTNDILVDKATGIEYIMKKRTKTGNPSIIPIITEARRIIDLYANDPQRIQRKLLIPMMSNQRYNNYLKQLGGLMGFDIVLTSHIGRKTAATTFLNKGVAMESVSAILGHSSIKMTQDHYATINPDRVIRDLSATNELSKAQ